MIKFAATRPFADADIAARKLIEIANDVRLCRTAASLRRALYTVRDEQFCVRYLRLVGRIAMKSFLLACVAAIVVAAVAAVVLNRVQEPVEQAFATTGVRL